jgi:hypothetical protein
MFDSESEISLTFLIDFRCGSFSGRVDGCPWITLMENLPLDEVGGSSYRLGITGYRQNDCVEITACWAE